MTSKFELFETLNEAKLNNPDDTVAHDLIRKDIFTFDAPLSSAETELFEYCNFGYVEPNPDFNNNQVYSSYVGDHISDSGVHSGHSGEHS